MKTGLLPENNRLAALSAAAAVVLALLGCHSNPPPVAPAPVVSQAAVITAPTSAAPNPAVTPSPKPRQEHKFDGESAFALLRKQCDFGPRPIGSSAHEKCLAFLLEEMRKYADETLTQKFNYKAGSVNLPNTNVIGVFYPAGTTKPSNHPILLMTHWDTRPIADGPYSTEKDRGFRFENGAWHPQAPILGASDAASGVAVLLQLAKMFKANPPPCGVVMLLDDGEDYGDFLGGGGEGDGVELGAHYFADHYKDKEYVPEFGQPTYGILLDMVGGKNAFFPREELSETGAAKTYDDRVFQKADELGYGAIFPKEKHQSVGDDHVWTNKAGIPTIDLIQPLPSLDYERTGYIYWHTLQDTPDHCSPKTLKAVGEVVAGVIYSEAP